MTTIFETKLCMKCKGKGLCGKSCKVYSKIQGFIPKTKTYFSGNSPPEIFIGRYNYPNVNAGILSPDDSEGVAFGKPIIPIKDTEEYSSPEIWHEKNFTIEQILTNRSKLIYGKFKTSVQKTRNKFTTLMQEISMSYKSVSTEFFLKKPPKQNLEFSKYTPIIGNPAPLEFARLQENPKVKPKVDYLVSDTDIKSADSIKELYKSDIQISDIIKILSAGLLGLKTQRKLVPTRWSITATDDTISKQLLKDIRYYSEIDEILLFNSEFHGNHYEILLLPDKYSFEVIEAEMKDGLWNQTQETSITQDYELFNGRKYYAKDVTGAYYANRLALCEYLEKTKKQATALFMREVRPEYYAPLGVGILRETTRHALQKQPEKFPTINEALKQAQTRLKLPIKTFKDNSVILKEYGQQTRLNKWF